MGEKQSDFLVVGAGLTSESIYYWGQSELEAHRHYKRASQKGKANLYKAYVYTCKMFDVQLIERYEILETIK